MLNTNNIIVNNNYRSFLFCRVIKCSDQIKIKKHQIPSMELNREKISSLQEEDLRESLNVLSHLSLKPEAHLQSLGFTINNRKARFILDDDTCPCLNAAPSNFSVIDESDTVSFVVLGQNSLDTIQASSLASYIDIQQKSMSLVCIYYLIHNSCLIFHIILLLQNLFFYIGF